MKTKGIEAEFFFPYQAILNCLCFYVSLFFILPFLYRFSKAVARNFTLVKKLPSLKTFPKIKKQVPPISIIVKGTEVIGLHLDKNIAITYLEKPEKTKIHLAEKHFKQEKKVPKHMPNSEKATPKKETFKKSDSQKAFFFSAHHSTAVALSPTQNKKLLVHFPKEAKAVIMIKQSSRELVLEKNNFNIPSVCLTANSIHPPPFV